MTTSPSPADISAGIAPTADAQARQEENSFASASSSPSPTTVPSRREELTSDLIEQQRHLRILTAVSTMVVILVTFILFVCSVVEIKSHLKDINQFSLWFLSILALPPTLLLVVLVKGIFAGKDEKSDSKQDGLPGPLVIKLIQEIIKPH